jgi:hypothetical protein
MIEGGDPPPHDNDRNNESKCRDRDPGDRGTICPSQVAIRKPKPNVVDDQTGGERQTRP